jgi:gamma-glutamyltranspeptidase / glutathione hydrolase
MEVALEHMHLNGVSSANPRATNIGIKILEQGGNAVDAAIAISYALGVLEPYASGIGGGGVMIIYFDGSTTPIIIDYRETAPDSKIDEKKIGIPGLVKGMEFLHKEYGSMPMDRLMAPSIELAYKGFPIGETFSNQLLKVKHINKEELKQFYPNNKPLSTGEVLKQEELAAVLEHIALKGSDFFYLGNVGKHVSKKMGISTNDLKKYNVVPRVPVKGYFRDYCVYSSPNPLGGVLIVQALQLFDILCKNNAEDISTLDLIQIVCTIINECDGRGYYNFGDPDFINIDESYLTSDQYCRKIASELLVKENLEEKHSIQDHNTTTQFVIMDKYGTTVSVTNSISYIFGSGVYCKGFFLNNQLKNFSNDKFSPNAPKPGKRPFSLIAPTILIKDGEIIGIGASGGQRIPTILCHVLIEFLRTKASIEEVIQKPRFHLNNETLHLEKGFSQWEINYLKKNGYKVKKHNEHFYFGSIQCLIKNKKENYIQGAADARRGGLCQIT